MKKCSLMCQRWLLAEGQSHHRLALNGKVEILPHVLAILSRFDFVIKHDLRCDSISVSIDDETLTLISFHYSSLICLKLCGCHDVTNVGMSAFAKNYRSLKKFSCGSCMFGAKCINALLDDCSSLEKFSIKRLRGINDGFPVDLIRPGAAASSLKSLCLKALYKRQCFSLLIIGSKNFKTLKLLRCLGDWDCLFESIGSMENHVTEIHLERLQVSDAGLNAISNCPKLEILHLVMVEKGKLVDDVAGWWWTVGGREGAGMKMVRSRYRDARDVKPTSNVGV
ncbi:F-box protein [Capsicum annuum]|uniref:F-box protein n=2 Tax=Capsicum annuum TaxID=4072 RepID=A0A2G3A491_CAPAN|nr:F-box protein [Capsicum annuum]PHT89057.1 F-box protein [Capsicum annuum]